MTKKSEAKSSTMQVKQTDDGLHLANSILWFDAQENGDLSFLSAASTTFNPKVPQVIATSETIKILEAFRKKPTALKCQYNRPFSIGRLRIELLPSGSTLGGASLYVETDQGSLLYAPQLQPHRIATVRAMQLKKAQVLVLGAAHRDPSEAMPNRKREKERLLETVQSLVKAGVYPVILCETIGTAQELTKLLSDHEVPVAVHDSIFKVNNIYEDYGSRLGAYTRFARKYAKQKVTLFPLPAKPGSPLPPILPDVPILCVESTAEPRTALNSSRQHTQRFYLSLSCDGPDMREIIATVSPKELYILGPYAKRYVSELIGSCAIINPLFVNDQPTLF